MKLGEILAEGKKYPDIKVRVSHLVDGMFWGLAGSGLPDVPREVVSALEDELTYRDDIVTTREIQLACAAADIEDHLDLIMKYAEDQKQS